MADKEVRTLHWLCDIRYAPLSGLHDFLLHLIITTLVHNRLHPLVVR
jgi:hypothetical protein